MTIYIYLSIILFIIKVPGKSAVEIHKTIILTVYFCLQATSEMKEDPTTSVLYLNRIKVGWVGRTINVDICLGKLIYDYIIKFVVR